MLLRCALFLLPGHASLVVLQGMAESTLKCRVKHEVCARPCCSVHCAYAVVGCSDGLLASSRRWHIMDRRPTWIRASTWLLLTRTVGDLYFVCTYTISVLVPAGE